MTLSFAFFREPNTNTLHFCKGELKILPKYWNLNSISNGFLLSPWANSEQIFLIASDKQEIASNAVLTELKGLESLLSISDHQSVPQIEFTRQIHQIQFDIAEGKLEKVVASRNVAENHSFDANQIYQWFLNLLEIHQNAMVSLVFTPEFGLWIGATPEVLLNIEGDELSTVSLAGTLVDSSAEWTEKEALEQSVTTKFIEGVLDEFASFSPVKSEVVEVKSGDIRHLKSHFKVQIDPKMVQNILNVLSPTPAVSGYPQKLAVSWIAQNEHYNRSLFSGFWGTKSGQSMHLYVNLRCAQITQNQHVFYAGCGINAGSEVEKEWIETTAKMNVTRKYRN